MPNLLVTLDGNYLPGLYVLLQSVFMNSEGAFAVYMFYNDIEERQLALLERYCAHYGASLHPLAIDENTFSGAPVSRYLTKAMYYRLLACDLMPESVDRVLYLDPDILAINPLDSLYETDLEGKVFGACMHTGFASLAAPISKIRLKNYDAEGYFNTGVILMDLAAGRGRVCSRDVFSYIEKKGGGLILQDQDVFNGLYGSITKPLDDSLYNYDINYAQVYRVVTGGEKDMEWVLNNTVILHYCGKVKPWMKPAANRFEVLFKHYHIMAGRVLQSLSQSEYVQLGKGTPNESELYEGATE